jgi:CheY-like chemotaxis protein
MNLATNARDAMPRGGRLYITTGKAVVEKGSQELYDLPAPGEYALISFADTGTGIEEESLGKIFEPFYTTKEIGKGTGLGLSLVHGIIKQHNGSILVKSEMGKGTTFNIYLPLIEGHVAEEIPEVSAPAPRGTGMETILVVEDEELVRVFIKNILKRSGYKVIEAENGEKAVWRFKENDEICLVLSDVIMPEKNGVEMLEDIRKIKPDIKAVFISGYSADVMHDKGIIEEGMELISKPFKKDQLLTKVRQMLDTD